MTVHVDPEGSAPGKIGRVVFCCHMFADTESELIAFAEKIGLKRSWLQCSGSYKVHFDLTLGKRKQAIANGAIEFDRLDSVNHRRKKRGDEPLPRNKYTDG